MNNFQVRKCKICGIEKPRGNFSKQTKSRDGLYSYCKQCSTEIRKARWIDSENRKYEESLHERWKQNNPERLRELNNIGSKRYAEYSRDKIKARSILNVAVKRGDVVKQRCDICGSDKSEAHHDDYSKPLEVRWLCKKHHEELHVCLK